MRPMSWTLAIALASCGPGQDYATVVRSLPPPDQPAPALSSDLRNLAVSEDGALVFAKYTSSSAGGLVFAHPSLRTLQTVPGAPVPKALSLWPQGHGYFAVHATTLGGRVAYSVVSYDLDAARRVWLKHLGTTGLTGFGPAANGKRLMIARSDPPVVELREIETGRTVGKIPIPGEMDTRVDASGDRVIVATATSLRSYQPLDGTSVCSATLPSYPAEYMPTVRIAASEGYAVLGRSFPRKDVSNEDVQIVDSADCHVVGVLPGTLHSLVGGVVVWTIDREHPSPSAPLPAEVTASSVRWHLGVTDLKTRATRTLPLGTVPDSFPFFAVAPGGTKALLFPRREGATGLPFRLADLSTGAIAPLQEAKGDELPAQYDPPAVTFAPDAAIAYLFTPRKMMRIDLDSQTVDYAEIPGGPIAVSGYPRTSPDLVVVPKTPWLLLERDLFLALVRRDTMALETKLVR